jgi:hypothetical protein
LGYFSIISLHRSGKSILNEYGGALPKIGFTFVGIKLFYLDFYFLPNKEIKLDTWLFAFVMFLFVVLILQNAIRILFWNEFGVKYNFIAVNYLVYTNEVIGNIMESYPVVPLLDFIIAGIVTYFVLKGRY